MKSNYNQSKTELKNKKTGGWRREEELHESFAVRDEQQEALLGFGQSWWFWKKL